MEKSEGIIIRLTKLTETSLIVHWCTEQHGLLKTVAKGARRNKSVYAGKLDLFYQAEFCWRRSAKSELHTLTELQVVDFRESLRKTYADTILAAYFGELLSLVIEPDHAVPEFYDLLVRGLKFISEGKADMRGMLHYENEIARLLGIASTRMSAKSMIEQNYGALPRCRDTCYGLLH